MPLIDPGDLPRLQLTQVPWEKVSQFLMDVGQQIELQVGEGDCVVVLTRQRFDALQEAQTAASAGHPPGGPSGHPSGHPSSLSSSLAHRQVTLTDRERQCLQMVAQDMTTADVARRLGLAQNTVSQHLASVRRRYGVRSTVAAAAIARTQGLIR